MSEITFYTNPMSRGQIARWALEEAGADYDAVILDYGTTMKGDDYLAVNPMGKVPAIVHDGRTVTEGAAICAYLANAFPAAGLAPQRDERADYYRWLFFAAGPVEQAITDKHLGIVPTEEQERMAGYGNLERVIDVLEGAIADRAVHLRRSVHHGRRVCRQSDRLGPAVRHDPRATRVRRLCRATARARCVSGGEGDRQCTDRRATGGLTKKARRIAPPGPYGC